MDTEQLQGIIKQAMLSDRFRLQRQYRELCREPSRKQGQSHKKPQTEKCATGEDAHNDSPQIKQWKELEEKAKLSSQLAQSRFDNLPKPEYDDALPVSERRHEIAEAIKNNQVVIIAGETGSGKTTQIPKICLDIGRGVFGLIGHTQPRRLAARSVADRIASELHSPLGELVGFKVRFNEQVKPTSYVKLMTDGILLAEIQNDRYLNRYDTIIIDEAHERSLNIDFLLGYLKNLLPKRPDLKVIITSATIDHFRFSEHFDDAPVIEVSGRMYPVETYYRAPLDDDESEGSLVQSVLRAVEETIELERKQGKGQPGGTLIFCSGEKDIRELATYLRRWGPPHTDILPLYARLSHKDQQKIFSPGKGRRIIIATNVAETSLTVPGIRNVIDLGTARISRYSYRSKVQRLPIEAISQASANQRKGRCGRVSEGVCLRLYSEEDFLSRSTFTDPEILRTNLASVILQMENLRLGRMEQFPFIEKPDNRFVKDGYRLLQELGAIGTKQTLTGMGKRLATLPVDPRIARMVLAADTEGSLREVLIIASALSAQDPRDRPFDQRQKADLAHKPFQDKRSDFITLLTIWQAYEEQRQILSQNKLRAYCREHFLNYMRMKEWREVHHQLRVACKQLGMKEQKTDASYAAIHKAMMAGLLSHLGLKDKDGEYLGARNSRFSIFPGSPLAKSKPQWIMVAELVETSKLFARHVAIVEPEWAESLAGDLLKHSYSDPVWRKRRGEVMAKQKTSLYGLVLQAERYVPYSGIDAPISRELFLSEGLVKEEIHTQGQFLEANARLMVELEQLENKARKRDILVDESALYDFYNARIPQDICSQSGFEKWRKAIEKKTPKLLFLSKEDLLRRDANEVTAAQFPNVLAWQDVHFPLRYSFSPGKTGDGVTVSVPQALLGQLPLKRLEWLVPGMLREKCIALLKGLPKKWRRNFVPIPDYVDVCLESLKVGDYSLSQKLTDALKKKKGITIPDEEWEAVQLDEQHLFNIEVVDAQGVILAQGRNLVALRETFSSPVQNEIDNPVKKAVEIQGATTWDFGQQSECVESVHSGITVRRYPAIIDKKDSVNVELCDSEQEAQRLSIKGVMRLLILNQAQSIRQLRKELAKNKTLVMAYRGLGTERELQDSLIEASCIHAFKIGNDKIFSKEDFDALYERGRSLLFNEVKQLEKQAEVIFSLYQNIEKKLKGNIPLLWANSLADVREQLDALIYTGFLAEVPSVQLKEYPRYLQAIMKRLEKLDGNIQRDRVATQEFKKVWEQYAKRADKHHREGVRDSALSQYRWMLEEYRVSLFAQELKTKVPVSPKRLRALWADISV